jgi:hypothetical protein
VSKQGGLDKGYLMLYLSVWKVAQPPRFCQQLFKLNLEFTI